MCISRCGHVRKMRNSSRIFSRISVRLTLARTRREIIAPSQFLHGSQYMKFTPVLLAALAAVSSTANAAAPSLLSRLSAAAPDANPKVIELALQAHECAIGTGVAPRATRLA